jgi:N-acetylglucosamine kinase-like BadF-type ATPase
VLAAASIDGAAIALISGTGSICYGRDAAGNRARSGGWGHLLGDEGSGYDLALRALRLATQTADGRAQAGEVLRAVLEQWGLSQAEDLIPFAYQRGTTRAEFAELAWPILALAEAGDEPAQALVAVISCELARQADAVGERLGLVQPLLAFGGGLLLGSQLLRQLVVEHLHIEVAGAVTVDDPCRGALRLAEALLEAERPQERPA